MKKFLYVCVIFTVSVISLIISIYLFPSTILDPKKIESLHITGFYSEEGIDTIHEINMVTDEYELIEGYCNIINSSRGRKKVDDILYNLIFTTVTSSINFIITNAIMKDMQPMTILVHQDNDIELNKYEIYTGKENLIRDIFLLINDNEYTEEKEMPIVEEP